MSFARTEDLAPSEVVAALVYLVDRPYLLADAQKMHRAIMMARDVCPLLKRFGFSSTGPVPISRSFDEALGILKLSRIVKMENTDYLRYYVDEAAKRYVSSEILPRLSAGDRESLESAAAIVREACEASAVPAVAV
jgi:hypothetical protein